MDLNDCLEILKKNNRLLTIKSKVDLKHELAGIANQFEGKEVLLFENIKGHTTPLVMGLFWNRKNLSKIYNCPTAGLPFKISNAVKNIDKIKKPFIHRREPKAQEVVDLEPDIPTATCLTLSAENALK